MTETKDGSSTVGNTSIVSVATNDEVAGTQMLVPRIGSAIDVHAFAKDPETPMMLACLEWPGETGLEGHSDADVAAHACCDALLAAARLGDLGTNFGVDRPEWSGASGEKFLLEVARMVRAKGMRIGNLTVQVIGNRPRMAKRLGECEHRLSEILGAPVSVSATTTDGLGFTGEGKGVAALATAVVFEGATELNPIESD